MSTPRDCISSVVPSPAASPQSERKGRDERLELLNALAVAHWYRAVT
jgi:hypothetical protein